MLKAGLAGGRGCRRASAKLINRQKKSRNAWPNHPIKAGPVNCIFFGNRRKKYEFWMRNRLARDAKANAHFLHGHISKTIEKPACKPHDCLPGVGPTLW